MCRMLLYKGRQPIQLAHLLTKPAHSIINQSFDSRLRLDHRRPINGDGFGVGWYDNEPDEELGVSPCIFTSVTPAWNNMNLIRLSEKIRSPLVFAHVRASTAGSVSESNCHPWQYGRLMFMHNGGIGDFHLIKRKVQESLSDEIFLAVNGNTDSELAFAVFLSQLSTPSQSNAFCHTTLKEAMLKTIAKLNAWTKEAGATEVSLMNFAVTDGVSVVCSRYISSRHLEAASLYYSSGTRFEEYKPGHYRMVKADKREDIVVIASEPLTFEKADWLTIPSNTVVVITSKMNVLMYPIVDEYYNPDPLGRATECVVPVLKDGTLSDGARDTAQREVVYVEDRRTDLVEMRNGMSPPGADSCSGPSTPVLSTSRSSQFTLSDTSLNTLSSSLSSTLSSSLSSLSSGDEFLEAGRERERRGLLLGSLSKEFDDVDDYYYMNSPGGFNRSIRSTPQLSHHRVFPSAH
ncbi:hypothetical protein MVEG_09495 [Podila verticillata NRRL 6337]|nr:hypothetical protein MVEG_09495 [Podila verticillata NRRL 6337]